MLQFWLLRLLSSCLNRSVILKQFHFLKPLDIFMTPLKFAKKVTLRDAKEYVDKVCIELQKTSDNASGKHTRDFSLQYKTFSRALNYYTPKTLEPQRKNRLKELWIRSGLYSQKVELSRVKYFYAFVSNSHLCLSHPCKQWQKKMNLDRKISTCLTTNYKKRINSR